MSSRRKIKHRYSLALRLTLWYAAIFALSSVIAFTLFYVIITSVIQERTDGDLLEDIGELSALLTEEGIHGLKAEVESEVASDGSDKVFYRLVSAEGRVLLATDMSAWQGVESSDAMRKRLANSTNPVLETLSVPGHEYGARTVYGVVGKGDILQIAESLEEDAEFLEVLQSSFALTVPVLMVLAALLGWFMASKALSGVREVTEAAIDISKGELDRRVPETGRGDEIDKLANTFNTMLDRIQALITGMREINDNIAHDLRSPLARIRGIAETALTSKQSIDEYQSVAADTIEECDRLIHMINTMLDITETEAGVPVNTMERIDMGGVVHDACDLFQPLAEDKSITLSWSAGSSAVVYGNKHYLQRLVANLLDNALKYTRRGGSVSVGIARQSGNVLITVRDTGIGIAEKEMPNIFKRFYRCDQSRSHAGTGLGLSLALAIARAHGGDITVSSVLGEGSSFTVVLPAVSNLT